MKITPDEFNKKNKYYPAKELIKNNKILCFSCKKKEANCYKINGYYSVGRCVKCAEKLREKDVLLGYPEFIPKRIKEERKEYFNTIVQPYREGVPSKEFAEANPDRAKGIFKNDYRKMQYVWKDIPNWSNRHKTK